MQLLELGDSKVVQKDSIDRGLKEIVHKGIQMFLADCRMFGKRYYFINCHCGLAMQTYCYNLFRISNILEQITCLDNNFTEVVMLIRYQCFNKVFFLHSIVNSANNY